MLKICLLAFLYIFLLSTKSKAQEITPTDLIQIFKFWRMDVKDFDRNTNDCLKLIDKKWIAPQPPDTTGGEFSVAWLYFKEPKEIPLEYGVMGSVSKKNSNNTSNKMLAYSFKGKKLWKEYIKQMQLLGAVHYNVSKKGDGITNWYETNSMKFMLTEFPPGINGKEATYSVSIVPL